MHIYFSGIGGVAIGPLSEIAFDAGYAVSGSDLHESLVTTELRERGINIAIGQDGSQIRATHERQPIDWVVYTAALPENHPELVFAREHGIRTSKRDELIAEIIRDKDLKLIAISGTHGKTTTTGMVIWALKQLGIQPSYSIGTTISFGSSGAYVPGSEYFVYECDEFDRNMLQFEPHLTIITSLDHDHFETYPTADEYRKAFTDFLQQSNYSLLWEKDLRYLATDPAADLEAYDELMRLDHLTLAGDHTRHNAFLVERALSRLLPDVSEREIRAALNSFPGTDRRFERIAENLYTDYGHHPVEIAATLQMAREVSDRIVLVYQPHQNIRQHEIKNDYTDCMELAEEIYWLPTYLSREDPSLEILQPQELVDNLTNKDSVHIAELNDALWRELKTHRDASKLVLVMGAGSIDDWARQMVAAEKL